MSDVRAEREKWRTQLRKGFVELCVLMSLSRRRRYGFELLEFLRSHGLVLSEGTLYPLLTRMGTEKMLQAEWETPESGHPRKFYTITGAGRALLEKMREEYEMNGQAYQKIVQAIGHEEIRT